MTDLQTAARALIKHWDSLETADLADAEESVDALRQALAETGNVIETRLNLHQKRLDVLNYLRRNYGDYNWPGGEQKGKKDFNEWMVLREIVRELKYMLELEQ